LAQGLGSKLHEHQRPPTLDIATCNLRAAQFPILFHGLMAGRMRCRLAASACGRRPCGPGPWRWWPAGSRPPRAGERWWPAGAPPPTTLTTLPSTSFTSSAAACSSPATANTLFSSHAAAPATSARAPVTAAVCSHGVSTAVAGTSFTSPEAVCSKCFLASFTSPAAVSSPCEEHTAMASTSFTSPAAVCSPCEEHTTSASTSFMPSTSFASPAAVGSPCEERGTSASTSFTSHAAVRGPYEEHTTSASTSFTSHAAICSPCEEHTTSASTPFTSPAAASVADAVDTIMASLADEFPDDPEAEAMARALMDWKESGHDNIAGYLDSLGGCSGPRMGPC